MTVSTYAHIYTYVCLCVCRCVCVRACVHACMHACMYVCMYDVSGMLLSEPGRWPTYIVYTYVPQVLCHHGIHNIADHTYVHARLDVVSHHTLEKFPSWSTVVVVYLTFMSHARGLITLECVCGVSVCMCVWGGVGVILLHLPPWTANVALSRSSRDVTHGLTLGWRARSNSHNGIYITDFR